jgi:hypothetical protein
MNLSCRCHMISVCPCTQFLPCSPLCCSALALDNALVAYFPRVQGLWLLWRRIHPAAPVCFASECASISRTFTWKRAPYATCIRCSTGEEHVSVLFWVSRNVCRHGMHGRRTYCLSSPVRHAAKSKPGPDALPVSNVAVSRSL